jgi:hypothetical protein
LPHEAVTVPSLQISPELASVQAPLATQLEPMTQALLAQPQSVGQLFASSPQLQLPSPHEETSCVPMQMVAVVAPQVPSLMQVPGAVWQPLAQTQSAAHLLAVSPQSQTRSPVRAAHHLVRGPI